MVVFETPPHVTPQDVQKILDLEDESVAVGVEAHKRYRDLTQARAEELMAKGFVIISYTDEQLVRSKILNPPEELQAVLCYCADKGRPPAGAFVQYAYDMAACTNNWTITLPLRPEDYGARAERDGSGRA